MPETWENALQAYSYSVDLSEFKDADKYPGWFQHTDSPVTGDPEATKKFEDRFRELAPHHLEVWYEVVFWKNYSQGMARDKVTRSAIKHTGTVYDRIGVEVTSELLWSLCSHYATSRQSEVFSLLRGMLFDSGIATAATFPAFLDPDKFPMVDIWIARWSKANGAQHSYAKHGGPSLVTYSDLGDSRLEDKDWNFVESWIDWCRYTKDILSERTERQWRARDVEMAVFTAQRSEGRITLNPLN